METALPHITEFQRTIIQKTISLIIDAVQPEKIICYGIRTVSHQRWSSFAKTLDNKTITSIDILVILQQKDKNKRESASNIVETFSNDSIRLITLVHSMDAVNTNLKEGNRFFTNLYNKGVLLYDSNRVPLTIPPGEVLTPNQQTTFNESNRHKSDLARMFYETACDCAKDGRNSVAVFMLHQSVELTCNALLRICLGYRPATHSIKKLFMLVENITWDAQTLFPRSTHQETEIFNILQRAYSDVRYKEGYMVPSDRVFILLERVGDFQAMASMHCQNKWNEMSKYQEYERES